MYSQKGTKAVSCAMLQPQGRNEGNINIGSIGVQRDTHHVVQPVSPEGFACKDIQLIPRSAFGKDRAVNGDLVGGIGVMNGGTVGAW